MEGTLSLEPAHHDCIADVGGSTYAFFDLDLFLEQDASSG
jgi:hypothetical protein